ncbi:MAG TPA: universal stress protein [bacterium]|nr:universal stress protein [bacterium]
MFERILSLCDLSRTSFMALEWAAGLSALCGSRLKVVHTLEWSPEKGDSWTVDEADLRIRTQVEAAFKAVVPDRCETLAAGVEIEVLEGKPVAALLSAVEKDAPDLVVMGTAGVSDLPHVLMGSVAEKLVRHSPSPVLVTRRSSAWPPRSVLLPVDFAGPEEETFALAETLAAALPLQFCLIHAITPVPHAVRPPPYPLPEDLVDGISPREKEAAEKLEALKEAHPKLEMTYCLPMGPAADQICRAAADMKSDLILIPTHSRSGLARFLMGGVAEQVVRYAPCAVLSHCPKTAAGYRRKFLTETQV